MYLNRAELKAKAYSYNLTMNVLAPTFESTVKVDWMHFLTSSTNFTGVSRNVTWL